MAQVRLTDGPAAGFFSDLDDPQQAKRELTESQALLQAVMNCTNDMIWSVDSVHFGLLSFNCSFRDYFLKNRDMHIKLGDRPEDLFPTEEILQLWHQTYRRALSESPFTTEYCTSSGDCVLQLSFNVLRGEGGVFGISIFGKNVTDQRRAEESLRLTQEALRQRMMLLSNIYENVSEIIFCLAVEAEGKYRFQSVNSAFLNVTGLDASQVLGKLVNEIIPEPSLRIVLSNYRKAIQSRGPVQWEENTPYPAGNKVGDVHVVPIFDEQNTCTYLLGTVYDITERKRAEEIRKETEDRYKQLFQNHSSIMLVIDTDTCNIIDANEAAATFYGWSVEELKEKKIYQLNEMSLEETRDDIGKLASAKQSRFERCHRLADGSVKNVEVHGKIIAVGGKNVMYSVIHDITERKGMEQVLRESEERFKKLFKSNASVQLILDPDTGNILDANEAAITFYGWSIEEFLKMSIEQINPSFSDISKSQFSRAISSGRQLKFEVQHRIADGSFRDVEVYSSKIEIAEKIVIYLIIHDITQRKEIEKKNQQLAVLVESSDDAIVSMDLDCRVTVWNKGAEHLYGYSEKEMIGSVPSLLIPPNLEEEAERVRVRAIHREPSLRFETTRLRKDGSQVVVDLILSAICDVRGKVVGIASVARDISARKQAEETLRASEERFRLFFQHSAAGMVIVSPDFHFLQANEAFCAMLGYTESELLEKTFQDVTLPEDQPAGSAFTHRVLSGEMDSFYFEKRYLKKNGAVVWGLVSATLIRDTQKKPLHFISQIQDVTERKRTEELLREGEERYRLMFESSPLAITITRGVEIFYANPSYLKLLGVSSIDELKRYQPLEMFAPELRSQIKENIQRRAQGLPVPDYYETVFLRKDGTRIHAVMYLTRVTFLEGQSTVTFITDITEQKRAEEEKARLQDQLIQAQKMESVGRLAGGVAHDFNNMLGVILGHTEMALEQADPAHPLHADLEEIHKAAERSAGLTRQLLAFARKQTIAPEELDLNQTLERMLRMLARLIGEDIHLIWKPTTNLWSVKMDSAQLDQILTNLCLNARDAIAGVGEITIETANSAIEEDYCAAHPGSAPGQYVLLAVRDNGCGMSQETLSHLFEPFFTTKEIGKGTGLGLATVYGIVKQNNGFIDVESAPGRGSTFSIYLPRHVGNGEQGRKQEAVASALRGQETILVVEDETANLKLISRMLERQGYTVLEAGSPTEAMRAAREHTGEIDLLITDVIMPEMNGRDLAKNLLSLYPHIKPLFMSGYPADVIANKGVLNEEVSFIQKPFSAKGLANTIRETLAKQ